MAITVSELQELVLEGDQIPDMSATLSGLRQMESVMRQMNAVAESTIMQAGKAVRRQSEHYSGLGRQMREAVAGVLCDFRPPVSLLESAIAESISAGYLDSALETRDLYVQPLPMKPQPSNTGAPECLKRLKQHIAAAKREAKEKGGFVLIVCKTPDGEILRHCSLESIDAYYISVTGVDINGAEQRFVTHFSNLQISVSLRMRDEFDEQPPPIN